MPKSAGLEFPAMLHGLSGAVLRRVRTKGRQWAGEYLKTGGFTPPQRMLPVSPGECLVLHPGADSNLIPHPRWRIHLFADVFSSLSQGVPKDERQRMDEVFESFCLNNPWGALYYVVSPPPPRSAERVARRLTALLRFWDVLQSPRYAFWFERQYTLEELVKDIYGKTLEAWCPQGPASVRAHLTLTVERMSRATREECMEAVLRMIPSLVAVDTEFKHRELLSDSGFLREHLRALSSKDFEDVSSAYPYTVTMQLADWDRALGRQ